MRAVVYDGPRSISVKDMPDARIERPTDVLVKITTTNICGSDLHMYEGRTDMEPGRILGHENLGQVIEVGDAVAKIQVGDLVCVPFNVACGHLRLGEDGWLQFAGKMGAIGIDQSKEDPVQRVPDETMGLGADRGSECVGHRAHDPGGTEHPDMTLNNVVTWFKGQKIGTGQCPVKRYNRQLPDLIAAGKAQPSFIVSHELPLERAAEGYEHFDERDDGWTEVVLEPGRSE